MLAIVHFNSKSPQVTAPQQHENCVTSLLSPKALLLVQGGAKISGQLSQFLASEVLDNSTL